MSQSNSDQNPEPTNQKLSSSVGEALTAKGMRYNQLFRLPRIVNPVSRHFMMKAKPVLGAAKAMRYSIYGASQYHIANITPQNSSLHQVREHLQHMVDSPVSSDRRIESE
ncbi:MAG: hypothetical protein RPU14_03815 [Candidatus Sedimenticola sp. (ex Thyasira tokunagai)]